MKAREVLDNVRGRGNVLLLCFRAMLGFGAASHTLCLNPFGLRILQIVDFGTTSGAERSSEPQIGIFDFQLFRSKAFERIDFFAENRKSLKRFGKRPAPARSGPKIKAVLPPSHLIGRASIYNRNILPWLLLLGSKADSTAFFFFHSIFSNRLSKRRRCFA